MSNWILYLVSVLIWGSTWLVINFQIDTVAPEASVVYRYAMASVLLFAWCLLKGLRLRFNLAAHMRFFLLGLFLFSINYIATYSAQQYISSALNAVAFSTMMWMNVLNARLFLGSHIERKVYLGAGLGMLGIIVLFWPEVSSVSFSDATLLGAGLCLGGAFVASLGNIVSQTAQKAALPVLQSNAWGMAYGTVITAVIAWRGEVPFSFDTSPSYIFSLLYLAIFGSIVAFGTYLKLVGRIGAPKAGYVVVMFPVVALILAILFEGLKIQPHIVFGVALVLLGNLVILGLGQTGLRLRYWLALVGFRPLHRPVRRVTTCKEI